MPGLRYIKMGRFTGKIRLRVRDVGKLSIGLIEHKTESNRGILMSYEGRVNTAMGIKALVQALGSLREDIIRARADGHIDKEEALDLFGALAMAIISEGLAVAVSVAVSQVSEKM